MLIFSLCIGGYTFAQSPFDQVILKYEEGMQKAAKLWMNKSFAMALDEFQENHDVLADNMPEPTDRYRWGAFLALKTYTIMLSRMVEAEMYSYEGQSDLLEPVVGQTHTWSSLLVEQATTWKKIEVELPDQRIFRNRWLKRFARAIQKARQMESNT